MSSSSESAASIAPDMPPARAARKGARIFMGSAAHLTTTLWPSGSEALSPQRQSCQHGRTSMAVPGRVERARGFSVLRLRAAAVPQLEMRYLGRVLLHAALVGAITGLAGSLFFVALEVVQRFLLED